MSKWILGIPLTDRALSFMLADKTWLLMRRAQWATRVQVKHTLWCNTISCHVVSQRNEKQNSITKEKCFLPLRHVCALNTKPINRRQWNTKSEWFPGAGARVFISGDRKRHWVREGSWLRWMADPDGDEVISQNRCMHGRSQAGWPQNQLCKKGLPKKRMSNYWARWTSKGAPDNANIVERQIIKGENASYVLTKCHFWDTFPRQLFSFTNLSWFCFLSSCAPLENL